MMSNTRGGGQLVPPLSLAQKRRILLGLSDEQIGELLRTGSEDDFEKVRNQTGMNIDQVKQVVSDPQILKRSRLNPNRLGSEQLKQVPGLTLAEIDTIMWGKPYYSMDELKSASSLTRSMIQELFEIEPYHFSDPITGREVTLEPISGRYILPPSDLEADPALAAGYTDVFAPSAQVGLRVVEAMDFESEHLPHVLKREFSGQVYPVMRDSEGFQRYLVPGAVDVWFHREVLESTRESILEDLHLHKTESVPEIGYYRTVLAFVPEDDVIHAALNAIGEALHQPEVRFAEPDQLGFGDFDPDLGDDQGEDEFESLDRYWNETVIDLASAHAITRGSPDVTVFAIDSGCRMDHEALGPGFRSDWESLDLSFDLGEPPEVISPHETAVSHGTKVVGVIRRMAPGCVILPIKIPGTSGGQAAPGYGLRAAAIFRALDYLRNGMHAVMNISWKTNGEHIGIREALRTAEARGLVLVASAGNFAPGATQRPNDLHYPSAHSYRSPVNGTLLSIAAVGPSDIRASYSYYGSDSISVSAPGGEPGGAGNSIHTTTTSTPSSHTYVAGTSFAAPHVTALAALLFSAKPEITAEQVVALIKDSADNVDTLNPGFGGHLGAGRINFRAALEQVSGPIPTHTIMATSGPHGSVVPDGSFAVSEGGSVHFEFVPDLGYQIAQVLLDGLSIGTPTSHSITDVFSDHSIAVAFVFADQSACDEPHGPININTATSAQLETLPYIGAWLANQIVSYRQVHGGYGSIWDLGVFGMSDWAIRQMASQITV